MKTLHVCGSTSWGGLEMHALKTVQALNERGIESALLCPPGSTLSRDAGTAGIRLLAHVESRRGILASILEMARLLRGTGFDIIHAHLSHDLSSIVPAAILVGWRGRIFLSKQMGSGRSKRDPFHRLIYSRIDTILAVSNYVRERILASTPVHPSCVRLLPNAIRTSDYQPGIISSPQIREELGIANEATVIGMVGRMTPMKGHQEFLEAAGLVLEKSGDGVLFLVVGGASYGEEEFEAQVRSIAAGSEKLSRAVTFTGFRKDIPRLLAAMDIFAFPSHREAFGIALLEAMAMGLPVVACDSGGVPDIVVPGETGLLVPPQSPQAFASELLTLIGNPSLRRTFGLNGRRRVEAQFTFEHHISQLMRFYAEKK